jgi:hypothetical protein
MHDEMTVILNWRSAYYHSHQNLLPFQKLSKKHKDLLYRTIILPVGLYGYDISCLSLGKIIVKGA